MRDAAFFHDQNPVAQGHCLALIVGDEHRGDAQPTQQLVQLTAQALAQLRIQCRQRFVEQQHPGTRRQCPGQCDPLPLTAGQLVDAAIAVAGQTDQFQQLIATLVALGSRQTTNLQAVNDIPGHIEVGKQRVVLKHHAHVAPLDGQACNVLIIEQHLADIRTFKPGNQPQGGGLAATGRTENRQRFAGLDGQVQILYSNGAIGKCLAAAFQANGGSAHRLSPRARRALMACNAISSGTISNRKRRV